MLKSLCLATVCLLSHVSALGCCNSGNVDYHNSNDNNISRVSEVQNAINVNSISGAYNWQTSFHFDDFTERYSDLFISFTDNENFSRVATLSFGNGEEMYYLLGISFEVDYVTLGSTAVESIYVGFDYFDNSYEEHFKAFTIYDLDVTDDIFGYQSLMFNCISSFYLDSNVKVVFDHIFTNQDNEYVTTYTGYYTFLNNGILLGTPHYNLFGTVTYSNIIYFTFNFYSQGNSYIDSAQLLKYNIIEQVYEPTTFFLSQKTSNLVYFDHVKMSRGDFTALNGSLGVFAYVNTSIPSSFEDLLFGIADSNIYMISSLLNFEMFGMNLYIALAGLITLLVVIFIIRKIW